jgi:hypothetical protein
MKTDRRHLRHAAGLQRLYVAQDANYNVTALIGTDGYVKERFPVHPLRPKNRPERQLDRRHGRLLPSVGG